MVVYFKRKKGQRFDIKRFIETFNKSFPSSAQSYLQYVEQQDYRVSKLITTYTIEKTLDEESNDAEEITDKLKESNISSTKKFSDDSSSTEEVVNSDSKEIVDLDSSSTEKVVDSDSSCSAEEVVNSDSSSTKEIVDSKNISVDHEGVTGKNRTYRNNTIKDENPFKLIKNTPVQQHQPYSEPCKLKFRCKKRKRCKYSHTPEEKEEFKQRRGRNIARKTKLCRYYPKYQKNTEECDYAHGEKDAICKVCNDKGHLTGNCNTSSSEDEDSA